MFTQMPIVEGCKLVFGGAEVGPLKLLEIFQETLQYMTDIPLCQQSRLNTIRVMLLGKKIEQDVYMWRTDVFPSKEKFYDAVKADLEQVLPSSCVNLQLP